MLGIWRFAGSYVPLEITHGAERLKSIMRDADVAAILIYDATRTLCEDIDGAQTATVVDVGTAGDIGEGVVSSFYTPTPPGSNCALYKRIYWYTKSN